MFATIVIIVLFLSAIVLLTAGVPAFDADFDRVEGKKWRTPGVVLLLLVVVWTFFACTFSVQAKNYGVLTSFGKPANETIDSGFHFKAPWQKDIQVDGTIHTNEYAGDSCINVRLGDGSQSCISATIRWQIIDSEASAVYANYRSDDPTDHFFHAVIDTQLKSVSLDALRDYNPIAQLAVVNAKDPNATIASFSPDYDAISKNMTSLMVERLGTTPQATIISVTLQGVPLADATQQKIDGFNQEVAKTRTSAQSVLTAANLAAANKVIADSISSAPGVLVKNCLDEVQAAIDKNYALPAGFNCNGTQPQVVIPATK